MGSAGKIRSRFGRSLLCIGILSIAAPFVRSADSRMQPTAWGDGYYTVGLGIFAGGGGNNGVTGNSSLGGEVFVFRGFAVGGEGGLLGGGSCCLPHISVNAARHFAKSRFRTKGLVPFVTGGFTVGSPEPGISVKGFNAGGGVTWWFRNRVGLRAEIRDYIFPPEHVNFLALRFGISFR